MDVRSGKTQGHSLLRREVQPPERHHAGLGVMLVAASAMFFAVASSAFLLRAQAPEQCLHRHQVSAPAAPPAPVLGPERSPGCGEALYQNNPDGTVSVVFDLCPTEVAAPAPRDEELIDVELVPIDGPAAAPSTHNP